MKTYKSIFRKSLHVRYYLIPELDTLIKHILDNLHHRDCTQYYSNQKILNLLLVYTNNSVVSMPISNRKTNFHHMCLDMTELLTCSLCDGKSQGRFKSSVLSIYILVECCWPLLACQRQRQKWQSHRCHNHMPK